MMLSALSHDFVHCRNIQITSHCSKKTPFMALTAGSYHTNLSNAIAKLYNQLCAADAQSTLLTLPEFQFADSGKTFSLVTSEHICTFSGLVKEEVNNFQVNIPFSQVISQGDTNGNNTVTKCAILSSCKFIFHELNINPKLLELLQVSTQLQSTSDDSHPHSLCLMDVVLAITKQKAEEMPHDSGVHAAIKSKHCVGTLEHYFKYSAPCSHGHPPKSRKVKATSPTLVAQSSFQPDTVSGLTICSLSYHLLIQHICNQMKLQSILVTPLLHHQPRQGQYHNRQKGKHT